MTPHDELMALAGKWAEPTPQDDCTLYTMGQRTGRNQCAADLRALLDSDAFRAMVRDVWLPIESAPEETAILVANPAWAESTPMIGLRQRGWSEIIAWGECSDIHPQPTLWRPLPAPPQAIDAAASGAGGS